MTGVSDVSLKELEATLLMGPIDPSAEEEMLPLPKGMALDKSLFDFPKCQVCYLSTYYIYYYIYYYINYYLAIYYIYI